MPASRIRCLARTLSVRPHAGRRCRARVGDPQRFEDLLDRAVLTVAAVEGDEGDVRARPAISCSTSSLPVSIGDRRRGPDGRRPSRDLRAGAQRDRALERAAALQDGDPQRCAHRSWRRRSAEPPSRRGSATTSASGLRVGLLGRRGGGRPATGACRSASRAGRAARDRACRCGGCPRGSGPRGCRRSSAASRRTAAGRPCRRPGRARTRRPCSSAPAPAGRSCRCARRASPR